MQIPEDSERPEGTSDSVPEPGREGDQAHHPRPCPPPPGHVRCPMLGCGRPHELPRTSGERRRY
ncbi:hypothetical protein G6W59_16385 [Streptomyces odorifer]|uniref:Uncharacterized protein n=1 Tax=Streptomyces odorifer TaxID=53450 RepID=A0A7Y6CC85_9ACTN|nr:hypothetical protein [Streptomyces odorifer]NUV38362.1 hypothetical protein [Streptomyces sp. KAI-27]NUV49778.1 hypothetical protein [Streptomyces sp. CAI-78]